MNDPYEPLSGPQSSQNIFDALAVLRQDIQMALDASLDWHRSAMNHLYTDFESGLDSPSLDSSGSDEVGSALKIQSPSPSDFQEQEIDMNGFFEPICAIAATDIYEELQTRAMSRGFTIGRYGLRNDTIQRFRCSKNHQNSTVGPLRPNDYVLVSSPTGVWRRNRFAAQSCQVRIVAKLVPSTSTWTVYPSSRGEMSHNHPPTWARLPSH